MDSIQKLQRILLDPLYQPNTTGNSSVLRPPVTKEQVEAVEQKLGFSLPPLLKRIYTEVANGGIGPAPYGLNALEELYSGNELPVVESPWPGVRLGLVHAAEPIPPDTDEDYEPEWHERDRVILAGQVFIADGGCQDMYFCDAAYPDFPVILQEEPIALPIEAFELTDGFSIVSYFGELIAPSFDNCTDDF
jgi:hypothetical protein